jgi:small subunit ribosomal protein S1
LRYAEEIQNIGDVESAIFTCGGGDFDEYIVHPLEMMLEVIADEAVKVKTEFLGTQRLCRVSFLDRLTAGDVIRAKVTSVEPFGVFVDVGCGIVSMLPIDSISVSRISHPEDRFAVGMPIWVVIRSIVPGDRICVTHKELLGTWEENAASFKPGQTVTGIVRSIETYGVFVELTPNLAGLAESCSKLKPGQQASVYIKSLIPDKMKIKLIIVDAFGGETEPKDPEYFITKGHLDFWKYSPENCSKNISTVFR